MAALCVSAITQCRHWFTIVPHTLLVLIMTISHHGYLSSYYYYAHVVQGALGVPGRPPWVCTLACMHACVVLGAVVLRACVVRGAVRVPTCVVRGARAPAAGPLDLCMHPGRGPFLPHATRHMHAGRGPFTPQATRHMHACRKKAIHATRYTTYACMQEEGHPRNTPQRGRSLFIHQRPALPK